MNDFGGIFVPILVKEDETGYLQTSYGTYDAMYVECIKRLYQIITQNEEELKTMKSQVDSNKNEIEFLKSSLSKLLEDQESL